MRAPSLTGRGSAAFAAALVTILVLNVSGPDVDAAKSPRGLARFMEAVGSVESGGDYTARNPVSGAYGKYQIMPSNWPAWARQYLGTANARQTPRNQERVAAGKITSLHRWLGNWRRVAYWWLTGSSKASGWSSYAKRYVAKVMARYQPRSVAARPPSIRVLNERSGAIVYRGKWRIARHGGYGGDAVRYAQSKGASATVRFTARRIAWHGPTGPTRGKAKVYVDGRYVKTVDLTACDVRSTSHALPDRLVEGRQAHIDDRRRRHERPPDGRDRRLHDPSLSRIGRVDKGTWPASIAGNPAKWSPGDPWAAFINQMSL